MVSIPVDFELWTERMGRRARIPAEVEEGTVRVRRRQRTRVEGRSNVGLTEVQVLRREKDRLMDQAMKRARAFKRNWQGRVW
jgi:hypothetical protein